MATDSSMKNISGVETYAGNLKKVSQQVDWIFKQLKKQTDSVKNS